MQIIDLPGESAPAIAWMVLMLLWVLLMEQYVCIHCLMLVWYGMASGECQCTHSVAFSRIVDFLLSALIVSLNFRRSAMANCIKALRCLGGLKGYIFSNGKNVDAIAWAVFAPDEHHIITVRPRYVLTYSQRQGWHRGTQVRRTYKS